MDLGDHLNRHPIVLYEIRFSWYFYFFFYGN